MNTPIQKVPIRDFQHNLANYLELAKTRPLIVTKYGNDEVIVANPKNFQNTKKKGSQSVTQKLRKIGFIGMHKNRPDWQGKSNQEIAYDLRHNAWYGK